MIWASFSGRALLADGRDCRRRHAVLSPSSSVRRSANEFGVVGLPLQQSFCVFPRAWRPNKRKAEVAWTRTPTTKPQPGCFLGVKADNVLPMRTTGDRPSPPTFEHRGPPWLLCKLTIPRSAPRLVGIFQALDFESWYDGASFVAARQMRVE